MGNIITPKQVIKKGGTDWQTKADKKDTQPTKMERTGNNTFNVHHEDGSIFECKRDPNKVQFKSDAWGEKYHISDNIKPRNVMSNADRRRLGLEEDPALDDYQGKGGS